MRIEDFLAHFRQVKVEKPGKQWMALCSAHEDKRRSLSLGLEDDGKKLVKCLAGCDTEVVVKAAGLSMRDLFPDRNQPMPPRGTVYVYRDESGIPLFEVVRRPGKGFYQRQPDGTASVKGVRKVLYRLPEILAVEAGTEFIFVVEGEKDADRLASFGWKATTNPGGATKWRPEFSESLRGQHVAILPDNDQSGRDHAQQVSESLSGIAASVRVIELPGLPEKGDVSDWLDAGNTPNDLSELVEKALGEYKLPSFYRETELAALTIDPPRVVWGRPDRILVTDRDITILHAREGLGKSWLVMGLTKAIASGASEFLGLPVQSVPVLLVAAELSAYWAQFRLGKIGQATERLCVVTEELLADLDLDDDSHVTRLAEQAKEAQAGLIVLDPLSNVWSGEEDNVGFKKLGRRIRRLARTAGAGVLLIHHEPKGDTSDEDALRGGTALSAWAKVILRLKGDDDDATAMQLRNWKNNLTARHKFGPFSMEKPWSPKPMSSKSRQEVVYSSLSAAVQEAGGPVPVSDLEDRCEHLSKRAIQRALVQLQELGRVSAEGSGRNVRWATK